MMNATELMQRVDKVVYAYKTAYGRFPDKVGVHAAQRHLLLRFVSYPVQPEIKAYEPTELKTLDAITYQIHKVRIEVVMGAAIVADEVYVALPGTEDKVVSGRFIEMLAQECVPQT